MATQIAAAEREALEKSRQPGSGCLSHRKAHLQPVSNASGCLADVRYPVVDVADAIFDVLTDTLQGAHLSLHDTTSHSAVDTARHLLTAADALSCRLTGLCEKSCTCGCFVLLQLCSCQQMLAARLPTGTASWSKSQHADDYDNV
jgi:hypothetical protein